MLQETAYLKYDTTGHYYYLTEQGATELAELDTNLWDNPTKRLKRMGRLLHVYYTMSRYNARPERMRHIDLIEYKIFKNEQGEVNAIQDALINFADLAEQEELDLDILNGMKEFPPMIYQPLKNANVLVYGEMVGIVPEEDYRVGY